MTVIGLVFGLVAGDAQFIDVEHHDIIAGVDVRREFRLVLAAQTMRDFGGEPSQHLACGIDYIPIVRYGFRLGVKCFHC